MVKGPEYDSSLRGGADAWDDGLAGEIFSSDYFEATITGRIKVFLSGVFEAKPVKVFLSGSWVTKPLKWWNGSAWVETNY